MTFVELVNEVPKVSTLRVAEGMELGHKAVMQLTTKYKKDFEDLGTLTFEMSKSGGRPTRFAWLNEEQTIFISTLMRNSIKVVSFKKQLSCDFLKMRRALLEIKLRQQNPEWVETRKTGKISRRQETDTIESFIEYATKQGSKSASRYFMNISKMENSALFMLTAKFSNVRDVLDGQQLQTIAVCDQIVAKALRDGMGEGMFYKDIFQEAKKEVLKFVELIGTSYVPKQQLLKG
jgi:phage regulator Rha-like protein